MKRPAPWSLEHPVMSRPSIELNDGSRAGRTTSEIVPTSTSESKEVLQSVHVPLLAECNQLGLRLALKEANVPVASGWTPAYLSWWQEQVRAQQIPDFFAVRLIGDANRPGLFSPFGLDHLAFCSKWGHNRVAQHIGREQVLSLTLPVETDPDIVCQAVSGLLGGFIKLLASNVEALLVLANSVGVCPASPSKIQPFQVESQGVDLHTCVSVLQFEALETACVSYLCSGTHNMTGEALCCLARLGDYLGLATLYDTAAEHLVQKPWEENMTTLKNLLEVPIFRQNTVRVRELLHHAKRGALSELQVLELSESCGMTEADIADVLDVHIMQPAELHVLLEILSDEKRTSLLLLRKAVSQHLNPTVQNTVHTDSSHIQIMRGIKMPCQEDEILYTAVPNSQLRLLVQTSSKGAGVGIYLMPTATESLSDLAQTLEFFALHTSVPYVRQRYTLDSEDFKDHPVGLGRGFGNYMTNLSKHYPEGFNGPFTIGVQWLEVISR